MKEVKFFEQGNVIGKNGIWLLITGFTGDLSRKHQRASRCFINDVDKSIIKTGCVTTDKGSKETTTYDNQYEAGGITEAEWRIQAKKEIEEELNAK